MVLILLQPLVASRLGPLSIPRTPSAKGLTTNRVVPPAMVVTNNTSIITITKDHAVSVADLVSLVTMDNKFIKF
jgi:hypothetical protein